MDNFKVTPISFNNSQIKLVVDALESLRKETEPGSWQRKDIDNLVDSINQQNWDHHEQYGQDGKIKTKYFTRAMSDENTQILTKAEDFRFGRQTLVGYLMDFEGKDESIILCAKEPKFDPFTGERIELDTGN
jgi:hypothetical protein